MLVRVFSGEGTAMRLPNDVLLLLLHDADNSLPIATSDSRQGDIA